MKNYFLIIMMLIASGQVDAQNALEDKLFSPSELTRDLDFLFETLENIHPNLYAYTPKDEVRTLRVKTTAALNKPMNRKEFALMVIPLISALDDAHTSLALPREERTTYLQEGGLIFPLEIRISEGRLFVKTNYTPDNGIALNDEIRSINGVPTSDILAEMRKYVSAELDFYKDVRIESEFKRLLWYIYGLGSNCTVGISKNGSLSEKEVAGISLETYRELTTKQRASAYSRPFSFHRMEGNMGLIDFRQMVDKKKFKTFLDSVFTVIKNDRIDYLIIDIRRNGGGNSRLGDMLFDYITDTPYKMAEQMDVKISRETKKSIRKNHLKWYLAPVIYPVGLFHPQGRLYLYGKSGKVGSFETRKLSKPHHKKSTFHGKTFLLTSHYTFSSAAMLAAAFKCYEMGTIIGEETGGILTAYGDVIGFQLPNTQLNGYCSHKRFTLPCDDAKVHGVKPDIEVSPSLDDISNQRDAVLEYVKKAVLTQNSAASNPATPTRRSL